MMVEKKSSKLMKTMKLYPPKLLIEPGAGKGFEPFSTIASYYQSLQRSAAESTAAAVQSCPSLPPGAPVIGS